MHATYRYPRYRSGRAPELDEAAPRRHPVVVVGAGPVGLACAIDLAQRGLPVLLLDDDDTVSVGSRGLCYAKRTLEILDRLGCGQPVVDKGVTWNVGRTFFDTDEVFHFNLLPEAGHERPGMVNLQQYYLEQYLVERAQAVPGLVLRWRHRVTGVTPLSASGPDDEGGAAGEGDGQGVRLQVETPDGVFTLDTDWLVVADGARSPLRHLLGLEMAGRVFQDRFLIADVVMEADFPAERWFWFDPPFHRGQSVLLHREADQVWRIDFQLGWDADPDEARQPENVIPRIRAMLGDERAFTLEWVSVYTFQCRRMERFRHGRVLFAGDAAHQVSPFGARGANSGLQDADNLGWKLQAVIDGLAPDTLLDSYSAERGAAADENLLNSTRSTDFITPKSVVSRLFRDAVLGLARDHAFARSLVNSGRLSVPTWLTGSSLNTPDHDGDGFAGWMQPGAPMDDAPVQVDGRPGWLLREFSRVGRDGFGVLVFGALADDLQGLVDPAGRLVLPGAPVPLGLARLQVPAQPVQAGEWADTDGHLARRYDGRAGTVYLIRPDQHVAARWRRMGRVDLLAALNRALGRSVEPTERMPSP